MIFHGANQNSPIICEAITKFLGVIIDHKFK